MARGPQSGPKLTKNGVFRGFFDFLVKGKFIYARKWSSNFFGELAFQFEPF